MTELEKVLIQRDGMSEEEVHELIEELRDEIAHGADPEEVLLNDLGLEPDYLFDLI